MTTIDLPPETPPSQALTKIESALPAVSNGITPAQAKIDAVASLTMSAYAKASELKLTKEETDGLQAEFPDDAFQPGAAGKEHLIYIEHAHLRDRFNSVFGMGQWAIVPRNRWAEDFQYESHNKTVKGSRVYVEAMLLVRGCFVGEAVGAMEYYPSNNSQNYGDAVEGAKTAALRRCAKELGVGLQAWKKEFCEGWWERRRKNGKGSNTRQYTTENSPSWEKNKSHQPNNSGVSAKNSRVAAEPPKQNTARTEAAATTGTAKPAKQIAYATKESRMRFLNHIGAAPEQPGEQMMRHFLMALPQHAILESESVVDMDLGLVPITANQTIWFTAALQDFERGGDAEIPFYNDLDNSGAGSDKPERKPHQPARGSTEPEPAAAPSDDEWFMRVVCPVPRKKMKRDQYMTNPDTIGSMYAARHTDDYLRGRLFGFMKGFVGGWTKDNGDKVPPTEADIDFREGLDALAQWLEKKGERI